MSYSVQWRRHRLTTRRGTLALGAMPVTILLSFWARSYHATYGLVAVLWVAGIACGVLFAVLTVNRGYFRGPRCGHLFSRLAWWTTVRVNRSCVHCGLPLYHDA